MNTSMNSEINLVRGNDAVNVVTTIMFRPGMPDMFIIEQGTAEKNNQIQLTLSEAAFLRQVIVDITHLNHRAKKLDDNIDDYD